MNNKRLIKIIVSGIIFLIASVLNYSNEYMAFCVYLIAYIVIGGNILKRSFKNILKGNIFDENFLMSIATLGAFFIGEYPEGVAVMLFYQIGELFQSYAVNKARTSITSLMDIRADYANVNRNGETLVVDPDEVLKGEIITIRAGEKIPLDCTLITGSSTIDTSSLTGEALPKEVTVGDKLLSGCININGLITAKVDEEFYDSTVYKILDLVENASNKKSKSENFISKFAKYYTPCVVIFSVLLALVPPLIAGFSTFDIWLYRALVFLVLSCPCALVISIPLGFFGGIGACSKSGILVKGSNYLEALAKTSTVVFDKTGTLTKGIFKVNSINSSNNFNENDLLMYTAYAESQSSHPIAKSILQKYNKEIPQKSINEINELAGFGIKALINDKTILVGNEKLMYKNNIDFVVQKNILGTVIYTAIDNVYAGFLTISDEVKENIQNDIMTLQNNGIKKTIMLTGDTQSVGEKIAETIGINEVYGDLLPQNKVEKLESIIDNKNKGEMVVFVGDGINDAPVLKRADIGIAMGAIGSDAAIEASDIVIMKDEIGKINTAIKISKKTLSIVKQNIYLSLIIKGVVLILGTFGLSTMWEAVFADVGVSIIAILNAIRVINTKNL